MESDLQIIIKGAQTELANNIGNAVFAAIEGLKQDNENLDISRMHRIILTGDFAGELADLSRETASGSSITYTNEEYAIAVAKTLLLPRNGDYEIVIVMNVNIATALAPKNEEGYKSPEFLKTLHLLHHELCHVHDNNKQIEAFNGSLLRHSYKGKDKYIRPLAELCWAEYIANVLSSSTASECWITTMTESLSNAIDRTKQKINEEIIEYRLRKKDLDQLINLLERHGGYLIRVAAHILGYIDGLDKPLDELSQKTRGNLSGSYFEPTWNAIQSSLCQMRCTYPDGWGDLGIYDRLADVIENYYGELGFFISSTKDGETYFDIPLRPETTPKF